MLDWKVGDAVVCIHEGDWVPPHIKNALAHHTFPVYRQIYTLREILIPDERIATKPGEPCIYLREIINPKLPSHTGGMIEIVWHAACFIKVTDIGALLNAMKTKTARIPALIKPAKVPEYIK